MHSLLLCCLILVCLRIDTAKLQKAPQYPLSVAKTMEFQVSVWKPSSFTPQPLIEIYKSKVRVMRPDSLRIELLTYNEQRRQTDNTITFLGLPPPNLIISNSKTQLWYTKWNNNKEMYPGVPKLENVFNEHACELLHIPDLLFSKDPIRENELQYQGVKAFEGGRGHCYLMDLTKQKQSIRFYLYLGVKDRLPIMLSEQALDRKGKWLETFREYYSNWRINLTIPQEAFAPDVPMISEPKPTAQNKP